MAAASERFFGLLSIEMSSLSGFPHYGAETGGKPCPWRVVGGKQFMGRTPAGSKAPDFYGTGGRTFVKRRTKAEAKTE